MPSRNAYEKFLSGKLVDIWNHAANFGENGHRNVYFSLIHLHFLPKWNEQMDVFDFAEDWVCEGEPDMATFPLIHEQRRDYFWEVQNRKPSNKVLDSTGHDAEMYGIRWLQE